MKNKDLKKIAEIIARAERTLQTSSDPVEVAKAKESILSVSEKVESLEDMMLIDDMVLKIITEKS